MWALEEGHVKLALCLSHVYLGSPPALRMAWSTVSSSGKPVPREALAGSEAAWFMAKGFWKLRDLDFHHGSAVFELCDLGCLFIFSEPRFSHL